jgi:hypothetical protein
LDLTTENNLGSKIDQSTADKLVYQVQQLYKQAKNIKEKDEKSGVDGLFPLPMIEDTENILNVFFEEFKLIQNDPNFTQKFDRISKEIRTEKRSEMMEK